jgi:hypothetical protein
MREPGDRHGEAGAWDNVAFAHHHLGDTQEATGDVESTRDTWQQALRIFDDLRQPDAAEARTRLDRTGRVPPAEHAAAVPG